MFKNNLLFQRIFLVGFIVFCFLGAWSTIEEDIFLDATFKTLRFTFLLLFYIASSKEISILYLISIGLFVVSSVLFSLSTYSVIAIAFLGLSRVPLVKILLVEMKNEYWESFKVVFLLFLGFFMLIIFLLKVNTSFFYMSVFSSLVLAVLVAMSFALFLWKENKAKYSIMFIGFFLFVITDVIFGAKKIGGTNNLYILMTTLLYNIAFYLITASMIKK